MIPLEEKIMRDFEISKFVVCTDAGLSSEDNRKFNNFGDRSFITTVSIKDIKISKKLQAWCLEPARWHLDGDKKPYDIRHLEDTPEDAEKNRELIFYKEKLIDGYDETGSRLTPFPCGKLCQEMVIKGQSASYYKETGAMRLAGEQFGRERMSEILFVVAKIVIF